MVPGPAVGRSCDARLQCQRTADLGLLRVMPNSLKLQVRVYYSDQEYCRTRNPSHRMSRRGGTEFGPNPGGRRLSCFFLGPLRTTTNWSAMVESCDMKDSTKRKLHAISKLGLPSQDIKKKLRASRADGSSLDDSCPKDQFGPHPMTELSPPGTPPKTVERAFEDNEHHETIISTPATICSKTKLADGFFALSASPPLPLRFPLALNLESEKIPILQKNHKPLAEKEQSLSQDRDSALQTPSDSNCTQPANFARPSGQLIAVVCTIILAALIQIFWHQSPSAVKSSTILAPPSTAPSVRGPEGRTGLKAALTPSAHAALILPNAKHIAARRVTAKLLPSFGRPANTSNSAVAEQTRSADKFGPGQAAAGSSALQPYRKPPGPFRRLLEACAAALSPVGDAPPHVQLERRLRSRMAPSGPSPSGPV